MMVLFECDLIVAQNILFVKGLKQPVYKVLNKCLYKVNEGKGDYCKGGINTNVFKHD